jgi:hypothetical protein
MLHNNLYVIFYPFLMSLYCNNAYELKLQMVIRARRGEGPCDLTQIEMIHRRVGWTYPPALPKSHKGTMWEGGCYSNY